MVLYTLDGEDTFNLELLDYLSHKENIEVRRLLDKVEPKNYRDGTGMTLLHHAVFFGNAEIVPYLVVRGCDVNAVNNQELRPISLALGLRQKSMIKALLAANADIFSSDGCNRSPLQIVLSLENNCNEELVMMFLEVVKNSAAGNSEEIAKALLKVDCPILQVLLLKNPGLTKYMVKNESSSSVNDKDCGDNTALHYAVRSMDLEHVKILVDAGADVSVVNCEMQTPLHLYQVQNDPGNEILRILLDKGAPLNVRDNLGYMTVTRFFGYADKDTIKMIFEYEIDLYATNADGTTLLHHATYNENSGVLELFRGRKFDVNAVVSNGESALWYAVEAVNPESLKFLLDNGANMSILDNAGYTAFFQGFYLWVDMKKKVKNCLKCIELFLEYGANFDCVDADGETIFDYALMFNSFVLTRPILEYMAMAEMIGKPVEMNEIFLLKVDLHEKFRSHFEFCKIKIETMKRIVVFENVTLFKFLKDDDRKLKKYARNKELVEKLKRIVYTMRNSKLYFVKILRRRVDKAIKAAKLWEEASVGLFKIEGLEKNYHIIEKILTFLRVDDLRNLSLY